MSTNDILLGELATIKGMDYVAAMQKTGSNTASYLVVLRQAYGDIGQISGEITSYAAKEEWKNYTIKVHAVKNVLALAGMEELSKWAYRLELASKSENFPLCAAETDNFVQAMSEFHTALSATSLFGEKIQAKDKIPAKVNELAIILKQLHDACLLGQSTEADKLSDRLTRLTYGAEADKELAEICDFVDMLDYDLAAEKCKTLVAKLA